MNRKPLLLVLVGALVVVAVGLGIYFALPHPTYLSGDAWDYTILTTEVPKDWKLVKHGVITPHDVAQQNLEADAPLPEAVSLKNFVQLYYAKYEPPPLSEYLDFTIQIILYQAAADAQTALAGGAPTEAGWESVSAPAIGDETRAWRFTAPDDPTLNQNLYRVDFRFLNGVASVTMIGTATALPNLNEPVGYAKKIHNKMLYKATPAELQDLRLLQMADLREVLLSQDDLAKLDDYLGGRWQIDVRIVPQWTPTDKISGEAQRELLQQLGRVSGYQAFYVKVLGETEKQLSIPAGLFQQVSTYQRVDSAAQALKMMAGLEQVTELPPPDLGNAARAWGGLLTTDDTGTPITLAVHEFDFQVGRYIGSIRLQSRPLAASELQSGQVINLQLALKLAQGLAAKLAQVEK